MSSTWTVTNWFGDLVAEGQDIPGVFDAAKRLEEPVYASEDLGEGQYGPVYKVTPKGTVYRLTRGEKWRWVPYLEA